MGGGEGGLGEAEGDEIGGLPCIICAVSVDVVSASLLSPASHDF